MRSSLQLLAFLFLALTSWASPAIHRPAVEDAIRHFRLDEAQSLAMGDSDSLVRVYYVPRILLMKYGATLEPRFIEPFLASVERGIEIAEKLPDTEAERGTLLGELYLQRGALHLMRRDYLAAATNLSSACGFATETHEAFPSDTEHLKVLGLLQVGLGTIPKKLRWLGNLICLRGDLEKGLVNLESNAGCATLMREESHIMLAFIEKSILNDGRSGLRRLRSLSQEHPSCYPYRYLLALAYLDTRNASEANKIFAGEEAGFKRDSRILWIPFWTFNRGNALYFQQDYHGAQRSYEEFLSIYQGESHFGEARFRLGMARALNGDVEGSQAEFAALTKMGTRKGYDGDAYVYQLALRYQSRSLTPTEASLFRARNLFDGGNYTSAIKELLPLTARASKLGVEDRAELYYRQGRILQEMGHAELAKESYGKCILENPDFNLWMKVYSHFYLGQLMEQSGKKDLARQLYHKALGFDNYYYQSGCEQRCKAALAELE